jgi:anti-sigma factor RsiW
MSLVRLLWWRQHELVCREAVELMTAYLDDALDAKQRARLEEHLAECPGCTEYLRQLRDTIDLLGRNSPEALDDDAVDGFVELYRRWRADSPGEQDPSRHELDE